MSVSDAKHEALRSEYDAATRSAASWFWLAVVLVDLLAAEWARPAEGLGQATGEAQAA